MKKFLGTMLVLLVSATAIAQFNISGVVTNRENEILKGASLVIRSKNFQTKLATNENGEFLISNLPAATYHLQAEYIGMETFDSSLQLSTSLQLRVQLNISDHFIEPLEVSSVRAGGKAPFTKTNITKSEIAKENLGFDIPMLLEQTPSVTVTTDAGNGVGYTGIRVRGTDATRINVTLNGIPFNDAESMGTYFVDLPDFISSVNSIQIQRDVGTSTNGPGAFGATINLSTNEWNKKAYAETDNSYGSFNTWKNTIRLGSGLLAEHFTVDARLSRIASDGYIDRATSDLKSFYVSAGYLGNKNSLRFNVFSGKEKTYQA